MHGSIDKLRRSAKALRKSFAAAEAEALARVRAVLPRRLRCAMPTRCMGSPGNRATQAGQS